MKAIKKSLSLVFVLLFIIGIVAGAYFLYTLPDDLVTRTTVVDLVEITEVMPFLSKIGVILGAAAFSGLMAIVLLMANAGKQSENVVYVEKFADDKAAAVAVNDDEHDHHSGDNDLIRIVREALASEGNARQKGESVLSAVSNKLEASQGALYLSRLGEGHRRIELFASYAFILPESATLTYEYGEGLAGQAAKEAKAVNISSVPDGYLKILSGLGGATPTNLAIVPFSKDGVVAGVVEIASFKPFTNREIKALEEAFAFIPEAIGEDDLPAARTSEVLAMDQELINE